MNNQLVLTALVIVTAVLSFGVFQMSGLAIIDAQENGEIGENGNITNNTESNMTEMNEELSIQGEILHNR